MRAGRGRNAKPFAYLDSGILVALAPGTVDMRHDGAVGACDEAGRGGCRLVTSPLAAMEAIDAARRRIAASRKCGPDNSEALLAADADVSGAAARVLAPINGTSKQGHLTVAGAEGRSPDFGLLQRRLLERAGRTVSGKRSMACRHRGIGPYDWFLCALARDAGASAICTTDAALAGIARRGSVFGHIRVWLAGGPPPGRAARPCAPAAAPQAWPSAGTGRRTAPRFRRAPIAQRVASKHGRLHGRRPAGRRRIRSILRARYAAREDMGKGVRVGRYYRRRHWHISAFGRGSRSHAVARRPPPGRRIARMPPAQPL